MTQVILDPTDLPADAPSPIPVHLLTEADASEFVASASPAIRGAARAAAFTGKLGDLAEVPNCEGALERVLFGVGAGHAGAMALRRLAGRLPSGDYRIESGGGSAGAGSLDAAAVAWALGAYRFDRYKRTRAPSPPRLVASSEVDVGRVSAIAAACALARDMINTPANDMGPLQIETIARGLARSHGAHVKVIVGDALLDEGYPAVHVVGRAAVPARAPRMIEFEWGASGKPLVVLVGKGVAFDTGGLDIKPSAGMRLMKKDMGGAAHALALASMIMALRLPIRLAVLIPAVENAISGDAMRPGDVLSSRSGLSIEVGNTDAEGRLILADALTRAAELSPDLTIDLATLTGAARVALGPQVIPFYTDDDSIAAALSSAAKDTEDPLWRMPLWTGYAAALESEIADIKNDPDGWAQAGSVTAALFLKRFAPSGAWIHLDLFGWNPRGRPGWPVGAEAQAVRALLAFIETRYA